MKQQFIGFSPRRFATYCTDSKTGFVTSAVIDSTRHYFQRGRKSGNLYMFHYDKLAKGWRIPEIGKFCGDDLRGVDTAIWLYESRRAEHAKLRRDLPRSVAHHLDSRLQAVFHEQITAETDIKSNIFGWRDRWSNHKAIHGLYMVIAMETQGDSPHKCEFWDNKSEREYRERFTSDNT